MIFYFEGKLVSMHCAITVNMTWSPKTPADIRVVLNRYYPGGESRSEVEYTTLDQVLRHYFLKLGYSGDNMRIVIGTLLTSGKVRVEYSSLIERVELTDQQDCLPREEAEKLVSDFIEDLSGESMSVSFEFEEPKLNVTRQITVIKKLSFDNIKVGDIVRGLYQNQAVTQITINQLNHPMTGIHTGRTPDGHNWLVRRGNGLPTQFFQVSRA